MKKTLLAIALVSTLCACERDYVPPTVDNTDEILIEQRRMANELEYTQRRIKHQLQDMQLR